MARVNKGTKYSMLITRFPRRKRTITKDLPCPRSVNQFQLRNLLLLTRLQCLD